jgi:2'-5' RNA ligase
LWPNPALRRRLHQLAVQYHAACGGRVMQRENLHLTLLFLGGVERAKLEQLQQAVGRLSFSPFTFYLRQFSCWKHNRIGYVAPDEEVAALQQLSHALLRVTSDAGINCDDRAFMPHVTLLRNLVRQVEAQPIRAVEWSVQAFSLMESVPTERGVRYRALQTWPC